jgi:2-polyprenyl-3-methyl-5-hydroxy-6-metoxy-1,4-benzoquinol methylase
MRYLLWLLLNLRLYDILFPARMQLARKYLSGCGIEIGALHMPLKTPRHAAVTYVDRESAEGLRRRYPELDIFHFTSVDIIDDGESLNTIAPNSQDFIIANHFIEHCENPIKVLITHMSRLKPGGILFMAVPDKDRTFDRARQTTSLDHVIRDYEDGPEWSRKDHYLEWLHLVEHLPESNVANRLQALITTRYSIHYHVWRQNDFSDMLHYVRKNLKTGFTIKESVSSYNEFIYILQKD